MFGYPPAYKDSDHTVMIAVMHWPDPNI